MRKILALFMAGALIASPVLASGSTSGGSSGSSGGGGHAGGSGGSGGGSHGGGFGGAHGGGFSFHGGFGGQSHSAAHAVTAHAVSAKAAMNARHHHHHYGTTALSSAHARGDFYHEGDGIGFCYPTYSAAS